MSELRSTTDLTALKPDFRFTPESRLRADIAPCPVRADIVAKVENRTTWRISLKSILRRACCRKALRRQYEGRWSFWYETIWSLTSPRVKRISASKIFPSTPQQDFCNNICHKQTSAPDRSPR